MEANVRRAVPGATPVLPRYSTNSSTSSSGLSGVRAGAGITAQTDNNMIATTCAHEIQRDSSLFGGVDDNNNDDDYYLHYTPLDDTEEWILFSAAESSSLNENHTTSYADTTSTNNSVLYNNNNNQQQDSSAQLAFPNHDGVGSFMDQTEITTKSDQASSSSSPDKAARINAWRLEQSHVIYNEITNATKTSHLDGDEEAAAASLETLLSNTNGAVIRDKTSTSPTTRHGILSIIADNLFKGVIRLDDDVLDIVFGGKQVDESNHKSTTTTMTPPMLVRYICTHLVSMMQADNRNGSSTATTTTNTTKSASSLRPIHAHPFIRHPPPPQQQSSSSNNNNPSHYYYSSLYSKKAATGAASLCSWQSLRSTSSRYHHHHNHHYWDTSSSATATESSFTNQVQLGF